MVEHKTKILTNKELLDFYLFNMELEIVEILFSSKYGYVIITTNDKSYTLICNNITEEEFLKKNDSIKHVKFNVINSDLILKLIDKDSVIKEHKLEIVEDNSFEENDDLSSDPDININNTSSSKKSPFGLVISLVCFWLIVGSVVYGVISYNNIQINKENKINIIKKNKQKIKEVNSIFGSGLVTFDQSPAHNWYKFQSYAIKDQYSWKKYDYPMFIKSDQKREPEKLIPAPDGDVMQFIGRSDIPNYEWMRTYSMDTVYCKLSNYKVGHNSDRTKNCEDAKRLVDYYPWLIHYKKAAELQAYIINKLGNTSNFTYDAKKELQSEDDNNKLITCDLNELSCKKSFIRNPIARVKSDEPGSRNEGENSFDEWTFVNLFRRSILHKYKNMISDYNEDLSDIQKYLARYPQFVKYEKEAQQEAEILIDNNMWDSL